MLWSGDYHSQGIDTAMLKGTAAPVGRYHIEAISPVFRKGRRPSLARAQPVQFYRKYYGYWGGAVLPSMIAMPGPPPSLGGAGGLSSEVRAEQIWASWESASPFIEVCSD